MREFAQSIPSASFKILDGAGHLPCIEQPELMAEAMLAFIEEKRLD